MDYKHAAQQVLDAIGGASNIVSAAHCATRLRLVIADNRQGGQERPSRTPRGPRASLRPRGSCKSSSAPAR